MSRILPNGRSTLFGSPINPAVLAITLATYLPVIFLIWLLVR